MTDDLVRRLVELAIDSERALDDVCADHPDLLPVVEQRVRAYRRLEDRLDRLLPPAESAPQPGPSEASTADARTPNIPGYEILSTLGTGGMGVVYLARHLVLRRTVAIKMLHEAPGTRFVERERLLREARAMAAVRHPNIVAVHDVGEIDGHPFFTMEHMEGGSLADRLGGRPRPPAEAASLTQVLADAMSEAHDRGIVHRDLKPSNVLLAADGTPKISDFGISRSEGAQPTITRTGARLGTPSYMAPEQALGRTEWIGPATDVYALGAVLYELLTGHPPFRGATAFDVEQRLLHEEPIPPRVLVSGVPRDLETICLACLHKAPHRRYASAKALADDLRRFHRREPIQARPIGRWERSVKWLRRRPASAAALATALVALISVVGTALWSASHRAAIEDAVTRDLADVVRFERAADWPGARKTLDRAKTRLGAVAGPTHLDRDIELLERELDLVDRLAALPFQRASARQVELDLATWWRAYRDAFAAGGLLDEGDAPATFAARVRTANARAAFVAAMDDWCVCAPSREQLDWLLTATRLADPDPVWRDRARDLTVLTDVDELCRLARDANVEREPPQLMLNVAGLLTHARSDEAMPFLRRIQAAHPSNFWASHALGEALHAIDDEAAVGFFRAALAVRPDAAFAQFNLGLALASHGRLDDAIGAMRRAVSLDGSSAVARHNLAVWLLRSGDAAGAAEQARIAVELDPAAPQMHGVLAHALIRLGQHRDAATTLRRGIESSSNDPALRARLERRLAACEAVLGSEAGASGR